MSALYHIEKGADYMRLVAFLVLLTLIVLPLPGWAWNIPGHMLSAAIAYQVLRQENLQSIEKAKSVLEKHPWYVNQWQARLQDVPVADYDQMFVYAGVKMGRRYTHPGQGSKQTVLALHQSALQTRWATSGCANQRTRASEHSNRVGRE